MPNSEWAGSLSAKLPTYFTLLSGQCSIVLSDSILQCSKVILAAQSPVLETHFMKAERDMNEIVTQRRKQFLELETAGERGAIRDCEDGEDDDGTDVLVMTEYYGNDGALTEFFRSFYSGEITISPSTFHITTKLACQFQVGWVITECCSFLSQHITSANFLQHFDFLLKLEEKSIIETVLAKLRTLGFSEVIEGSVENKDSSGSVPMEILRLKLESFLLLIENLQPPTELHIAYLSFAWLHHDLPHRKLKLHTLLSHLRLIHLPQSFVNEIILKFAEVHDVETTDLFRMVLGVQSYFFSRSNFPSLRSKTQQRFPVVFSSRNCYRGSEEREFSVDVEHDIVKEDWTEQGLVGEDGMEDGMKDGVEETGDASLRTTADNDEFTLIREEGKCYLRFRRPCYYVYLTDPVLVERYRVSEVFLPVYEREGVYQTLTIIPLSDKSVRSINFVAVFFDR